MSRADKVTVRDIIKAKSNRKIVMVTAYDYAFARLVDSAGVDIILVGDSVGMVVHGYPSTHYVDMDMMLLHVSSVARARPRALLVADMPFLSYEPDPVVAVENAGLMIRSGADAVKIEGGSEYADTVKAMVRAGIPVMGHIGLNPQRSLVIGGYRKRGIRDSEAQSIINDAVELERAGVFSLVIEFTAADVAKEVTEKVSVPTICIGSGPHCDGQVLVLHDILGFYPEIPPFAKKYTNIAEIVVKAVETFAHEVRTGAFPAPQHYFTKKSS